jgi:hypothetical protein
MGQNVNRRDLNLRTRDHQNQLFQSEEVGVKSQRSRPERQLMEPSTWTYDSTHDFNGRYQKLLRGVNEPTIILTSCLGRTG